MKLKTVSAAVTLINGVWTIAAGVYWNRVFEPVNPPILTSLSSENIVLIVLGVILVLDSIACYLGWTEALYASAAISALGVMDIAVGGIQLATPAFVGSALLGLLAIAVDLLAARRRVFIPEEDHPLNLPVFG